MKVWVFSPKTDLDEVVGYDRPFAESRLLFQCQGYESPGLLFPMASKDNFDTYEFKGTREELDAWVERVNIFFPWIVLGAE